MFKELAVGRWNWAKRQGGPQKVSSGKEQGCVSVGSVETMARHLDSVQSSCWHFNRISLATVRRAACGTPGEGRRGERLTLKVMSTVLPARGSVVPGRGGDVGGFEVYWRDETCWEIGAWVWWGKKRSQGCGPGFGMTIWVAGSVSFAEREILKERQDFSLVAEQEITSSILDTVTLRCPFDTMEMGFWSSREKTVFISETVVYRWSLKSWKSMTLPRENL